MLDAWNEKHVVQGKRGRISTKAIATRRLAKKAAEGDLKAFEKFERLEAEHAANSTARSAGSRFFEPADALTMADIVRRIRNMPTEEPSPQGELKQGAGRLGNFADPLEQENGAPPSDDEQDRS